MAPVSLVANPVQATCNMLRSVTGLMARWQLLSSGDLSLLPLTSFLHAPMLHSNLHIISLRVKVSLLWVLHCYVV